MSRVSGQQIFSSPLWRMLVVLIFHLRSMLLPLTLDVIFNL